MMPSLGAPELVLLAVLVVLVLDSRRLRALASKRRRRGGPASIGEQGIPAGASPDQVGLPLRQIQMRSHVDWQDGGIGWDGPEILPADQLAAGDAGADGAPALTVGVQTRSKSAASPCPPPMHMVSSP